jgi:hypothetical protein
MNQLTLESDGIFLDRVDCGLWDCGLAVDKNGGHINLFPLYGHLESRQLMTPVENPKFHRLLRRCR